MDWFRSMRRWTTVAAIVAFGVLGKPESRSGGELAGQGHRDTDCSLCHRLVASVDAVSVNPEPTQQCFRCHTPEELSFSETTKAFHWNQNRPCGSCHLFHEPLRIVAGGRPFTLSEYGAAACSACHNALESTSSLSEGHQLAAQLFHSDNSALFGLTTSERCLLCHSEERTTAVEGISALTIPRFSERHMHPVGVMKHDLRSDSEMSVRQDIDPRLQLYGNRIECHTCHLLTSQSKYRLVELGSPRDLCLGCHNYQ